MTSIFPLLEAIKFEEGEYPLNLQAKMIQSQPSWMDQIAQLKQGDIDNSYYQDIYEFNSMLFVSDISWIQAGQYLVGFSSYFLHDPEARYNEYETPHKIAIIQQIANKLCSKYPELYKQLVVAKNNYNNYKKQKLAKKIKK